jgi:hypothetical protein
LYNPQIASEGGTLRVSSISRTDRLRQQKPDVIQVPYITADLCKPPGSPFPAAAPTPPRIASRSPTSRATSILVGLHRGRVATMLACMVLWPSTRKRLDNMLRLGGVVTVPPSAGTP